MDIDIAGESDFGDKIMSSNSNFAPPGTSTYASDTMYVGDGTWDKSRNTFLLPNLVGLNFDTMVYNGMSVLTAVGCLLTSLRNGESLSGDGRLLSSHSRPRGHSRYRIFRIGAYFNPNHPILSGPLLGVEASHMVPGPHVATNNGGIYARLVCSWAPTKLIQSTSWNRACDLCLSYLPGPLGLAGPSTGGWEKEASHSIESDGMTDKRIKSSLL